MSIGRDLAIGVLDGRWTLEDLDVPAGGFDEIENDRARSAYPADRTMPRDLRRSAPVMAYRWAGKRLEHRNLAREWIATNRQAWAELQAARREPIAVESQTMAVAGWRP
jgi:hypothetical protein